MKHDTFIIRYISFFLASVLMFFSSSAYLPVKGEEELYSKVLRLHVIAESDDDRDQTVKLLVRDRILYELDRIYSEYGVNDLESAEKAVVFEHDRLLEAVHDELGRAGVEYTAELELTHENYPRKSYNKVTLPAGRYDSVVIRLGKARGKNWWCVLYPTLCLASASSSKDDINTYVYGENEEKFISAGFTLDELKIITDSESSNIKIKLRILEILEDILSHKS